MCPQYAKPVITRRGMNVSVATCHTVRYQARREGREGSIRNAGAGPGFPPWPEPGSQQPACKATSTKVKSSSPDQGRPGRPPATGGSRETNPGPGLTGQGLGGASSVEYNTLLCYRLDIQGTRTSHTIVLLSPGSYREKQVNKKTTELRLDNIETGYYCRKRPSV